MLYLTFCFITIHNTDPKNVKQMIKKSEELNKEDNYFTGKFENIFFQKARNIKQSIGMNNKKFLDNVPTATFYEPLVLLNDGHYFLHISPFSIIILSLCIAVFIGLIILFFYRRTNDDAEPLLP